jgi:hypothetical protein
MDPYVYLGTNVLRNLRDLRDADRLDKFEAIATTRRAVELGHAPIGGGFDARHLRAIHQYIFQDVYDWAGEFRTVDISKSGDPFAFSDHIVSSLDKTLAELRREGRLSASIFRALPGAGRGTWARSTPFFRSATAMGGRNASSSGSLGCVMDGRLTGRGYRESK